jgi:transposase
MENYPSDLSGEKWENIKVLFQIDYNRGGSPPKHNKRELLNAIVYLAKTRCQWRCLPKCYPSWQTTYKYFRIWLNADVFERINHRLRKQLRRLLGKEEDPIAAVVDSQSAKTAEKGGSVVLTLGRK